MALKYVASKRGGTVIFTGGITHQDMAQSMGWSKDDITGAGFVHGLASDDVEKIETVGESVSLGIKADPEDKWRIISEIRGY